MSMNHDELAHSENSPFSLDPVVPFVRDPYSRFRVQTIPVGESLTLQSEADACDINNIIARYDRDGFLPPARMQGSYGDVSLLNRPFAELVDEARQVSTDLAIALARKAKEPLPPATSTTDQPSGDMGGVPPKDKGPGPAGHV